MKCLRVVETKDYDVLETKEEVVNCVCFPKEGMYVYVDDEDNRVERVNADVVCTRDKYNDYHEYYWKELFKKGGEHNVFRYVKTTLHSEKRD